MSYSKQSAVLVRRVNEIWSQASPLHMDIAMSGT